MPRLSSLQFNLLIIYMGIDIYVGCGCARWIWAQCKNGLDLYLQLIYNCLVLFGQVKIHRYVDNDVGVKLFTFNYIILCQLPWGLWPSLWPSGIGSGLGRNRLWVRFLAVSDIYPMFIEPTITWVPSGFSGYIWLDTKIVLKKKKIVSLTMDANILYFMIFF